MGYIQRGAGEAPIAAGLLENITVQNIAIHYSQQLRVNAPAGKNGESVT
jgi:hypothetical protein